ncbi:TPA: hypothetical protein U1X07_002212 [Streptococcus suis]|nr:hypothetical protein [Streptococcus suis]
MKIFKKSIIVFATLFSMLGFISISTVFADNTVTTSNTNISTTTDYSYTGEIVPYKTSYGNGGYTKIELYGGGREVWWSVKPNTSKSYTYSGLITVTFSDNTTRIYPVSKSGKGGQSVSGSFGLPKKARNAGISGIAYGAGGVQISIPTIE